MVIRMDTTQNIPLINQSETKNCSKKDKENKEQKINSNETYCKYNQILPKLLLVANRR